ncbi:MAG TPA: hypothetical protein VFJ02_22990 [Vicinamibacterales bacterium]|nr:hypothetical protein [Vicinamibacterales bacterium]
MAKTRAKRRVKKAKTSAAVSLSQLRQYKGFRAELKALAHAIVKEIIDEMNLTLMAVGKSFSAGALDEWSDKLLISVMARLLDGGDWGKDRSNVLAVASDMALISAILSGSSPTVNKGRVHASFRAVKDHATCPGTLGSGRWCDFDI